MLGRVPAMLTIHTVQEVVFVIRTASELLAACVISACAAAAFGVNEQPAVTVELRRAEFEPRVGLKEATVEGSGLKIYLHQAAELSNEDIAEAKGNVLEDDSLAVAVMFTAAGRAKMERVSKEHHSKPLAIVIDGKVTSAPVLRDIISERALITGRFTPEDIERIVRGLRRERPSPRRPAHTAETVIPGEPDRIDSDGSQRAADQAKAAAAMADLQGIWLWTNADGTKTAPADEVWAEVSGDRLTVTALRAIIFDFTFTLNPDASPKAMNLIDRRKDGQAEKLSAIYELKGNVLRICIPNDGHAPRPLEFTSPPAAGTALITLTRKP